MISTWCFVCCDGLQATTRRKDQSISPCQGWSYTLKPTPLNAKHWVPCANCAYLCAFIACLVANRSSRTTVRFNVQCVQETGNLNGPSAASYPDNFFQVSVGQVEGKEAECVALPWKHAPNHKPERLQGRLLVYSRC